MLKDVRAAIDRLAQRVDGVEAAAAGGQPGAAPTFALATAGAAQRPALATSGAATARSRASTASLAGAAAGSMRLVEGPGKFYSTWGGAFVGFSRGDAADGDASVAHNGTLEGAGADGSRLRYFSNLPYAQASLVVAGC
jgi:hypothetical protein